MMAWQEPTEEEVADVCGRLDSSELAAMAYLEHKYCPKCGKPRKSPVMRRNSYFCLGVGLLGICALIALAKIGGWW